jgi:hypothetical protein
MRIRLAGVVLLLPLFLPASARADGHKADFFAAASLAHGSALGGFNGSVGAAFDALFPRTVNVLFDFSIFNGSHDGNEEKPVVVLGGVRFWFRGEAYLQYKAARLQKIADRLQKAADAQKDSADAQKAAARAQKAADDARKAADAPPSNFAFFGHVLVGSAAPNDGSTGFDKSFLVGGGMDYVFSRRLRWDSAFRVQVDYLAQRGHDLTPRVSAGVAFRFKGFEPH